WIGRALSRAARRPGRRAARPPATAPFARRARRGSARSRARRAGPARCRSGAATPLAAVRLYSEAMRILYRVVGEGMGHAMRSRVVLEHLFSQGHQVAIMASGRAADFLQKRFEGVNPIHGMHIIYEENRVRRGKTFWSNVLQGAAALPTNIDAYFKLID